MREYIDFQECFLSGKHLTDCDADGYCNFCGYQEDAMDETGRPLFTEDDEAE